MIVLASSPNSPPPPHGERPHVYLQAGQIFASREPHEVSTVLGSCVGVLLVDPARRFGGACHYLLPFDASGPSATARFGTVAISHLVRTMLSLGSRKVDLMAKVFGGASLLKGVRPNAPSLGAKNIQVARVRLEAEGIPIVAEDVGGYTGRKLVFLTDDGHAWVKTLGGE